MMNPLSIWLVLSCLYAFAAVLGAKVSCRGAHWPLSTKSCEVSPEAAVGFSGKKPVLIYDHGFSFQNEATFSALPELAALWGISGPAEVSRGVNCCSEFACSVFVALPHDPAQYGAAGSNYYVFHVDILLPVWNHVRNKLGCARGGSDDAVSIFVFHVQDNKIKMDSDIFQNQNSFWDQSFRFIFGSSYVPVTAESLHRLQAPRAGAAAEVSPSGVIDRVRHEDFHGTLCFDHVSFGVPEYSYPSKRAVSSLNELMRKRIFENCTEQCLNNVPAALHDTILLHTQKHKASGAAALLDSLDRAVCGCAAAAVGLVTRRGRRRVSNEAALLAAVHAHIPEASMRLVDFGTNGSMRDDLLSVQDLAVLIGFQGSGLINAMYLPKVTAVAAVYSSFSWPLASGDPLELISNRGPYLRHVCKEGRCPMRCDEGSTDVYCDSGDVDIAPAEFLEAVRGALELHAAECAKLDSKQRTTRT